MSTDTFAVLTLDSTAEGASGVDHSMSLWVHVWEGMLDMRRIIDIYIYVYTHTHNHMHTYMHACMQINTHMCRYEDFMRKMRAGSFHTIQAFFIMAT